METYFSDDSTTLYHGDSLAVLKQLPDSSVDCCVTSPPYFGLRDYGVSPTDWPEVLYSPIVGMPAVTVPAMSCPLGAESDPAAFIAHLRLVFAEVRRVLADDGTAWLNLGDSYVSKPPGNVRGVSDATGLHGGRTSDAYRERLAAGHGTKSDTTKFGLPEKNLIGIPWRAAFALQGEGWFLRQENVWGKRSCMPEAVTDRTSRSHEQVFHLTKSPRYWYDADAIREESDPEQVAHNERYAKVYATQADRAATTGQPGNVNSAGIHSRPGKPGRNARTVWSMATQPFSEAHFAVMPAALAERCVMAGCKPGGTVLDPFSGSGTTGLAAAKHGRKYVGIDLNADYLDLSLRTRLAQPGLDFGEASA
jgi:site-specific DNA-methyltransferase (cytosine-N4-specific)